MTNATTTEAKNGSEAVPQVQGAASPRNAHQRQLAVMARCSEIVPDKTHPAHGFRYVSIQTLSNHLRKYCAEEGLSVVTSITDGQVVVQLVNADNPEDQIVTTWPVVAGDRGFAFSIKFPLMRLFLVGDGEENDEAEMATASGHAATQAASRQPATPRQPTATHGTRSPLGPCPECAEEGITAASGKPAVYWPPREPGPGRVPQCNGIRDGVYLNHQLRERTPALTGGGQAVQAFADGTPTPADDQIPF